MGSVRERFGKKRGGQTVENYALGIFFFFF